MSKGILFVRYNTLYVRILQLVGRFCLSIKNSNSFFFLVRGAAAIDVDDSSDDTDQFFQSMMSDDFDM